VTRPLKQDLPKSTANVGKRVGGSLYIHRDALPLLGELVLRVEEAEKHANGAAWNVAKIEKTSISLLLYESFDTDFPALLASAKVALPAGTVRRTDYQSRANPPILHRKELLLPPDDPRMPQFRALTAAAEDHGLFRNPNRIGTRAAWDELIAQAGLRLHKGRLVRVDDEHIEVARHRTAIVRRDLSQPLQLMMRFGIVTQSRSFFDYGCGQGEDVAALSSQGFEAFGWDPHHAASGQRRAADVVNLGFVLNVIEDPRERVETLKAAWGFAQRALCIAVMIEGKASTIGQRPYRDGVVTSRGTFQKYFIQQELREFVAKATEESPIALAPGIVAVFRDKDLEQEVVFRHRSRSLFTGSLPRPPTRERRATIRLGFRERAAAALEQLRAIAVPLGRPPELDEVPSNLLAELSAQRVGWARARELLRGELKADEVFARSQDARRDDLLVHLALMQFPGSPKYRRLPRSIQADIKALFRNHAAAQEESRRLLFAAGDRAGVNTDVQSAITAGLGEVRNSRWFRFRASTLPHLASRLRVLVGCAEVLQGGVDACDFVEIDLETPRIVMITCDDGDQRIPFVVERTTVDLARLRVSTNKFETNSARLNL
jgi:DNA phosphorothioation-associated putative methyltransferase